MKLRRGKLTVAVGIFLVLAAAALFFFSRPPVLIVTDASFAALYGTRRMLLRQIRASLRLWRLVKPVVIAEGAGSDVLVFAIAEAASTGFSRRPYCVLVPRRYAEGGRRYGEQFPEVPVALLEERSGPGIDGTAASGNFFVFSTDVEWDWYRAGLCAAVLGGGKTGQILVFQDRFIQTSGQDAFIKGLREQENRTYPQFLSAFPDPFNAADISCVVLAGFGAEYLDKNLEFPVIFFTWLDPGLTARETVLIFDDSAWALVIPVVKMIAENRHEGRIPSDLLIISAKIADKEILRQLKKTVRVR